MKLILILLAVLAAFAALLAIFARLKPIDAKRLSAMPGPDVPGFHTLPGGVKVVLPLSELPEDAPEKLRQIISQTPRTKGVAGGQGHSFITRSRLFGFPDVTRIWVADDALHIHAHLVIGKSDLGVNGDRVRQWLTQLGYTAS